MKLPSFDMLSLLLQAGHRILTDLNSIMGLCALLAQNNGDNFSPEQQEYLLTLTNTVERITMLVKEILSSSKIPGGEEVYESFRLMPLISDCLDNTAFAREYHEVQLLIQTPFSETLELEGPQLAIHHCLLKCLQVLIPMNAGKKLAFHIAVDMNPFSLPLKKTRLQMTLGFENVDLSQLRQVFYQSDDLDAFLFHQQLKRAGLTLKIQTNSKSNNSVENSLTLTGEYQQSVEIKPSTKTRVNPIQHILLVDDHALNNQILSTLLNGEGYTVYMASSGLEALTLWQKYPIDLILMDLHMPEMDGFETVSAIREIEKETATYVPIIALTAAYQYNYQAHCLASGFDAFMAKPLKLKQLLTFIEHLNTTSGTQYSDLFCEKKTPATRQNLNWYSLENDLSTDDPALSLALIEEILSLYVCDTTEILAQLDDALRNRETEKALSLCHGLKGTSLNIHAHAMAETCLILEQALKEPPFQENPPQSDLNQLLLEALLSQLCKAFNELKTELYYHHPKLNTLPRAAS